jgi:hypothetical protein
MPVELIGFSDSDRDRSVVAPLIPQQMRSPFQHGGRGRAMAYAGKETPLIPEKDNSASTAAPRGTECGGRHHRRPSEPRYTAVKGPSVSIAPRSDPARSIVATAAATGEDSPSLAGRARAPCRPPQAVPGRCRRSRRLRADGPRAGDERGGGERGGAAAGGATASGSGLGIGPAREVRPGPGPAGALRR